MQQNQSGILIIDKPANISSARVVARIKKALGARKAGHAGTLDPFATGVMVCCINQATRLARFFLHSEKTYRAVLRLGITTDTQDLTGNVLAHCGTTDFPDKKLRSVFSEFEGKLQQHPPAFSALKYKGIPLYKLARKGTPVQKPPRSIHISSIEIIKIDLPEICFEVTCSAGTYIRTLCADIGARLGCGGHLKELRRTRSSGFDIENAIGLEEFEEIARSGQAADLMIRMNNALYKMPGYTADTVLKQKIMTGQTIGAEDITAAALTGPGNLVKIVDEDANLLAVLQLKQKHRKLEYCCVFHP